MQVQSITSTVRYSQTPKGAFYEIFSALWANKTFAHNSWCPLMYKFFWKQKTLSDAKRAPLRIFSVARKFFDIFFVIPPLRFNKNFARDKWSTPETSRNTQNFSETKKLRAKIVIPPYVLHFSIPKAFRNTEVSPDESFWYCGRENFWKFFCNTSSMFHQIFALDRWAAPILSWYQFVMALAWKSVARLHVGRLFSKWFVYSQAIWR